MFLRFIFFATCFLVSVLSYKHQQSLAKKLWSESCKGKSWVLNDCNWCWCERTKYQCKARVCSEVDMFGHFKDAIQELHIGMEGRGSWRSKTTACQPGVPYQRNGVICVCNEDGEWPNPVCRDTFRILYSVESSGVTEVTGNETCFPNNLYLVGCNICLCPSYGYLDIKYCTKNKCPADEPVFESDTKSEINIKADEIYATCDNDKRYSFGCRQCVCLKNNRLLCDHCPERSTKSIDKTYCLNRQPNEIFNIDCNLCQCDKDLNLYCTVKKCLDLNSAESKEIIARSNHYDVLANNDDVCSFAKYKNDCNTCRCTRNGNNEKVLDCSLKRCNKNHRIHEDCVEDTVYELNCMICECRIVFNEKRQICKSNPKCQDKSLSKGRLQDIQNMHGYCEPLHTYKKDCNLCQCLPDGKTLKCRSRVCPQTKSTAVDIVPFVMKHGLECSDGRSFRIDCNLCFCLLNGNSICTTLKCNKIND